MTERKKTSLSKQNKQANKKRKNVLINEINFIYNKNKKLKFERIIKRYEEITAAKAKQNNQTTTYTY